MVSKRKDLPYRSGRSPDWLKMKNPACEARGGRGVGEMTTLTMRYLRGHFVVTAPDIEPVIFKSRRKQGIGVPNIIPVHPSGKSAPTRPSEQPSPGHS
jgi:hypothetical protein